MHYQRLCWQVRILPIEIVSIPYSTQQTSIQYAIKIPFVQKCVENKSSKGVEMVKKHDRVHTLMVTSIIN